jgi:hypothetical protein
MPRGFDITAACGAKAAEIKGAGYDFVARYLSKSAWKVITPAEADQLRNAGLAIVLVYEDGPTTSDYFTNERGQVDATRAAQQAAALGAPDNTTIYFTVDYDASDSDATGAVTQYFQGAVGALRVFAAANGLHYRVGVYGSGATCAAITGAGLATQGWLAQSKGYRGYLSYTGWSIKQGMPTTVIGSLHVDPDDAIGDYGAIPPTAAET